MKKHIENVQLFGVPVIVAINSFVTDTSKECEMVQQLCREAGAYDAVICDHWSKGGEGLGIDIYNLLGELLKMKLTKKS